MKKFFLIALIFFTSLQAQAFEECIITTNGKLTDIKIEDNTVINVYPLITVMNDKNTLFVKPLKVGETDFSVLKNGKHFQNFKVKVSEEKTVISEAKGYIVLSLDVPPNVFNFVLDKPPIIKKDNKENKK